MKFIDYSIKNTIVVRFMVVILVLGGLLSFKQLGKLEDPEFKIKEAMIITLYPGASAHQVELFVTDKIEESLQKIPNIEFTESVSKTGYSQVKIKLQESIKSEKLDQYWDNVRKKIDDTQIFLPTGVIPSLVLDDYGAVYGIFLAVTSDGYSYSELSKYAEYIKKDLHSIRGVSKTEIFGNPSEVVNVYIDRNKINSLGISTKVIATSLMSENLITGGGSLDYGNTKVNLTFTNEITSVEELKNLIIFSKKLPNGTNDIIRLGDIAKIEKTYPDTIKQKMLFNGKKSIGISLSPEQGANVVDIGKVIDKKINLLKEKLPIGINIEKIYYQPDLVSSAINNFVFNLILSVITVVGVLLFTMGMKSGLIIGSGLILSILGTLIFMLAMKIDLQRVSLGSFIIAMGMLVDNSIVVVDGVLIGLNKNMGMDVSLENSTHKPAVPLLGATIIATLAFLPAYLMKTYIGEYVSSSFWVIGASLMLSWFLCLTQTPVYCKLYINKEDLKESPQYEVKFYKKTERLLVHLTDNPRKTLTFVGIAFAFSMLLFIKIPKTFFPASDKKGFIINLWAPEGSKINVVEDATLKLEKYLSKNKNIENITVALGASPARYYVSTVPELPNTSFGELIISVDKLKNLDSIAKSANTFANNNLPGIMVSVKKYPNGVATPYPIEVSFSGPDPKILRELSEKAMDIMRNNSYCLNVKTDWRNKILSLDGKFSQINANKANITPFDITTTLMRTTDGITIGRLKDTDKLLPVVLKEMNTSKDLKNIGQTPVWGFLGKAEPLSSVVKNQKLNFVDGQICRKDRVRTIKVQCDIPIEISADVVRNSLKKDIENISLPKGYSLEWKGEYFEQVKNIKALLVTLPIPMILMFSICVLLFASVKIAGLIFLMVPLSMIGIAPGLFITGKTFGFMSAIGFIALAGIMIKNVIVLMDEINFQINGLKQEPKQAVINSSISRTRAVSLAAITTIFGMLPLLRDPLYGDMAATIIFGLFIATILTLFIFPVIYMVAYKIK